MAPPKAAMNVDAATLYCWFCIAFHEAVQYICLKHNPFPNTKHPQPLTTNTAPIHRLSYVHYQGGGGV